MAEQPDVAAEAPEPQDSRIVVILDGQTPMPKYIDFQKITPFHLVAIGEWLALKGRQMIVAAENAEVAAGNIQVPGMDEELTKQVLGMGKGQ